MVVYWTVNNILSIAQQYILLKKTKKKSIKLIKDYVMDNEWKFLKEVHSFGDLPDDLIPNLFSGVDQMLGNQLSSIF